MDRDLFCYNQLDPVIEAKVNALLRQMTLEEKVGQLVLTNAFAPIDWGEVIRQQKMAEEKGEHYTVPLEESPVIIEKIRAGQVSAVNSADVRINNNLQRIAREESRLGVPLLVGNDVIHGFRTIFPIPLAEACTWNPDLLERAAQVAASEAATMGINWIYAPMVDIARDPRWGRIAEGAGEDPFLGRAMSAARVRGFQSSALPGGRRIAACPKHFAAYGGAEAGRDYNTVDISERTLRDVYLPPFKAGFDAGAASTMSAFNEIGGVPGTCNPFLLGTVLRSEWGWPGVVVSDYNSIGELVQHGVAANLREAARLSILAGIDIDMDSGAYAAHLGALVEAGEVTVEVLDESVRRVLRLKFSLGLFEDPYTEPTLAATYLLTPESRVLALEVARQSLVLLKNEDNCLPLVQDHQRVALIGPLANNRTDLLGAWAITGQSADVETLLAGMQRYLGEGDLVYAEGCAAHGDARLDIDSAVAAARSADVVVLAVGEGRDLSGEANSRAYLGLPGHQQALVDALAAIGKPLVVVLMCGRPLVVPDLVAQASALLVAWHGGICAGQAVADTLFGVSNPSGKLTASWPRAVGQIPVYYGHKSTGRPAEGSGTTQWYEPFKSVYLDIPNTPLFSFGEGLSYTTFAYSDLNVMTPSLARNGTLRVSAWIQNTGEMAGVEIVQLYVSDLVGSVTRPVKELKGFQRAALNPGESCEVVFELPASELGFHGADMRYTVEPGAFTVWVGPDSRGGLMGKFEIF